MNRCHVCVAGLPVIVLLAVATAARAEESSLILDVNAYGRGWYQFGWERVSAAALKAEPGEAFNENELKRFAAEVKKRLAGRNIDWEKQDWRDHAIFRGFRMGGTGDLARCEAATTDPPPTDWPGPEFDDSDWGRFMHLFATGEPNGWHFAQWRMENPGFQAGFYRYRFVVPDPSAAALTVEASYYGGARIFVNGTEIARGHLPAGEVTRGALAEDYPLGAYRRLWTELDEKEQERARRKGQVKEGQEPKYFGHVGWNVEPDSRIWKLRHRAIAPTRIPARLLRQGVNVLAVEIRAAPLHPAACDSEWLGIGGEHSAAWFHARLCDLKLTGRGAVGAMHRPAGVQVWAEDATRRVWNREFLEPGAEPGEIRLVVGPNGTCAAQVVVGTDQELSGVKVSVGELTGEAGTIRPSAVEVLGMIGHPAGEMEKALGQGRIPVFQCAVSPGFSWPIRMAMDRFAGDISDKDARKKALAETLYFDHIAAKLPETIAAGTCQAYWLRMKVPAVAAPGTYRGQVRVSIPGRPAVTVPISVQVVAWRVPDPRDFQFHVAIEQSPYGVARQYSVELWSAEHLKLVAASLDQLARVGNDWFFVPVLLQTEFGNDEDQPIKWTRRKDGSLAFDYADLDKYLDLIVAHCGRPRVISFVVMHGTATSPIEVMVHDEASGKAERVALGGAPADAEVRRTYWAAFANDLYRHMTAKGLAEAMHWGYAWDTEGDPLLKPLLRGVVPQVFWTSGSHNTRRGGSGGGGRLDTNYYKSTSEIYSYCISADSRMGWKNPDLCLSTPRAESTSICVEGHSNPFMWRLLVERDLVSGFNGVGRIGGDYWAEAYWHKMRGSEWHMAGFPVLTCLWAGQRGAEPSARFESLIEGIQEGEARIFIEQAIDRGLLDEDLAAKAAKVLFDSNRQTLSIPSHVSANWMTEGAQNWRARSKALYELAAEVADAVGLDVARTSLRTHVQPFSRPVETIRLRNWTGKPRKWTAKADVAWLKPAASAGSAEGFADLPVTIGSSGLEPGKTATGTVEITDGATGKVHKVTIEAETGKVFAFPDKVVVNGPPGEKVRHEGLALFNNSAKELPFKATVSESWAKTVPAEGTLPAGKITFLAMEITPPGKSGANAAEMSIQVGPAGKTVPVTVYSIPAYTLPAEPKGEGVWLYEADKDKLVSVTGHVCVGVDAVANRRRPPSERVDTHWWQNGPMYNGHNIAGGAKEHMVYDRDRSTVPYPMGDRNFERGLWCLPHQQTTYAIDEKAGFRAFSAWVGFNKGMERDARANRAAVMNAEIYVDGEMKAQSGLMKVGEPPRLIVVSGLAGAREISFVTRLSDGGDDERVVLTWGDPKFWK